MRMESLFHSFKFVSGKKKTKRKQKQNLGITDYSVERRSERLINASGCKLIRRVVTLCRLVRYRLQ